MLGSKGQEEGPFALLLAAVMLALLIPIVASLFGQFQQWECESRLSNNLETLARELELSATLGGGERKVLLDLGAYTCGSLVVTNFTIKSPDEGDCMDYCQTPQCRMIRAERQHTPDEGLGDVPEVVVPAVCVRIPLNVEMKTTGCSGGLTDVNLNNIEPGVHTLVLTKELYSVQICEEVQ